MRNLIAFAILLLLFLNLNNLKAQDVITYSGPVEYYLEVSKTAAGKGTDGGFNWNVTIDESRIIKGSFFVTFSGNASGVGGMNMYELTSIEENIEFSHEINNEGNDQKSMGKDMPDSERSRSYAMTSTRLSPEKPVITAGFLMFQNGKYRILLTGEMEVSTTYEISKKETYPLNRPPTSFTETKIMKFPIVISGEANNENLKYLEGATKQRDEQSDDCRKCMDGNLASLVHGDMNCSYNSKITTSWTLVKRTKECDAIISNVKGDVKINGVPAKNGSIKVGAGDVLETGPKSRIQINLDNFSTMIRMGSKSKLVLSGPCTSKIKPMSTAQSISTFIRGKFFAKSLKHPSHLTRQDFDSDDDWYFFLTLHGHFNTAVAGVRGQLWRQPQTFYASANTDFNPYLYQQEDSEKAELISGHEIIPDDFSAFYIHFDEDVVKDLTVLKGTLIIEDSKQINNKTINESETINNWDDGTIMSDVNISVQ